MPAGADELTQAMSKALEPVVEELQQIRKLLEQDRRGGGSGGGSAGSPGVGLARGRSSGFSASRAGAMFSGGGITRAGAIRSISGGVTSALGGGAVAGLAGGAVGAAASVAWDTLGYITKPSWKAVKSAAVNYGADILSGRSAPTRGALGRNVGARLSEAFEDVPIFGGAYKEANDPVRTAGDRVKGITTQIARYGGTVSPELRRSLQQRFEGEDRRAQTEAKEVDKLTRERLGSDELQNTRTENIAATLSRLADALAALVLNKNASGGVK